MERKGKISNTRKRSVFKRGMNILLLAKRKIILYEEKHQYTNALIHRTKFLYISNMTSKLRYV